MGYYTTFRGFVDGPDEFMQKFEEDAENNAKFGEYEFELFDWISDDTIGGDSIKWYGWQADLETVSKLYPNLLFSLNGEDEEPGDIWKAWARNGKVVLVKAEIVFRELDFDKELPAPDVEEAILKLKTEKKTKIDAQIAKLQAEKDAL